MKRILVGCSAALLSLSIQAQDEAPPVDAPPNAFETLEQRWYASPSVFWAFADGGRDTDNGYGAALAVGRAFTQELLLEGVAQFNQFDHDRGGETADLIGLGVNGLFFPTRKTPAYLLLGAAYGDVSSHPGGEEDYGTLLMNVGGGYWWKPFDLGFIKGMSLRTDAIWRLDAHNDRRTGDTEDNGRKAFQDILLSVGLVVPIGAVAVPPPPEPEPVEVAPVVAPLDIDGDGVTDDVDQCPDTPPGTAVDTSGCPATPPAPACKSPEPGEKLDLSGCGSGDVIVLKGVNFDFNKDRLTPNAKTILDGVGEALQAAPATHVEIGGHTDAKGSDDYNQRLSDRRACAVGRYLKGKSVDGGRMTPLGYGETKPVDDNETDEGREQNRRVELRILDGAGEGLGSCGGSTMPRATAAAPESVVETAAEATPESTSEPNTETASVADAARPQESVPVTQAPLDSQPTSEAGAAESPVVEMVPPDEVYGPQTSPAASESVAPAANPGANGIEMVPADQVF